MYTVGNNASGRRAFTLVELLVVIGLIAALATGIGLSMRGGNPTAAMRGAQGSVVSMLSSARGQAALSQSDAMLVIDVTNPAQEEFLRSIQVVVRAGSGLDEWRAVGSPVLLPQGIYIVPPSSGYTLPSSVSLAPGWSANRRSKGFLGSSGLTERAYHATNYPYQPSGAFVDKTYLKFQPFTSLGTTNSSGTILITSGQRTGATTISLNNPEMIRGVYVSRYGVPTLINEAATFENVTIP